MYCYYCVYRKNISRIKDEQIKYSYKPFKETYYKVEQLHFRIDYKFNELIENFIKCNNGESDCELDLKPKMKKFLKDRYIFIVNK